MAYGFLKRMSKKDEWLKDYVAEKMVFEAFIYLIRESDLSFDKINEEIEKEANLKGSRLTNEEYTSLLYELNDYKTGVAT